MKKLLYFTIMSCFFSVGMVFTAQNNRNPENRYDAAAIDLQKIEQIWGDVSIPESEIEHLLSRIQLLHGNVDLLSKQLLQGQQNKTAVEKELDAVKKELDTAKIELDLQIKSVQRLRELNSELGDKYGELSCNLFLEQDRRQRVEKSLQDATEKLAAAKRTQEYNSLHRSFLVGAIVGAAVTACGSSKCLVQ